jgi:hypothetical protein
MRLRRYWFEFEGADVASGIRGGCGVTTFDRADALDLLRIAVGVIPEPSLVVEDIDVSTLDVGHVLPNMHPPSERGVWFPMFGMFA